MQLATQISGHNHAENLAFASKLKELGVDVRYAQHLGLHNAWHAYDAAVEQFNRIATSSFHAVLNINGIVDNTMSLHVLYAMLAGTPVIFNDLPSFTDDVDTYSQRLISSRLHSFHVTSLQKNGLPEMNSVIRHLADISVDYSLNVHDEILIRSKIRNYLRDLVKPAQTTIDQLEPTKLNLATAAPSLA